MAKLGYSRLKGIRRQIASARFALARIIRGQRRLQDEQFSYRFECSSVRELKRISSAYIKEVGTVKWLRSQLSEGDVFYDIGANVGLYSLMAASRVGDTGQVYAFEPAAANFAILINNIKLNAFSARITPCSTALTDESGFFPFHYQELMGGASGSQLHAAIDDHEQQFTPQITEMKHGASIDWLFSQNLLRPPKLIKIDVDGNEARILRGMEKLLTSDQGPEMISVEMNIREHDETGRFLDQCGYHLSDRNDTLGGLKRLSKGAKFVAYNGIFTKKNSP